MASAVNGTNTEQTEVAVSYLTGDKLGNRGVVFSDFQSSSTEILHTVNATGGNVGFVNAHFNLSLDVLGLDVGAET